MFVANLPRTTTSASPASPAPPAPSAPSAPAAAQPTPVAPECGGSPGPAAATTIEQDAMQQPPAPGAGGRLIAEDGRTMPFRGCSIEVDAATGLTRVRGMLRPSLPCGDELKTLRLVELIRRSRPDQPVAHIEARVASIDGLRLVLEFTLAGPLRWDPDRVAVVGGDQIRLDPSATTRSGDYLAGVVIRLVIDCLSATAPTRLIDWLRAAPRRIMVHMTDASSVELAIQCPR